MLSTPNTRPEPPRDTSTSTANQVRGLPRTLTSLPLPAHSLRHARCGGADNLPPNGPLGAQVQLHSTFPCAFLAPSQRLNLFPSNHAGEVPNQVRAAVAQPNPNRF